MGGGGEEPSKAKSNGLRLWTSVGGEVLTIEAVALRRPKGKNGSKQARWAMSCRKSIQAAITRSFRSPWRVC